MTTGRFELMASDQSALQVYEIVSFGEEVSDQSAFRQGEAFVDPLSRLRYVLTYQKDLLSCFRRAYVLHQTKAIEMALPSLPT